ncbi:choice-of-anchor D domain-containing protein [Verrucomicrobiota bacterium]
MNKKYAFLILGLIVVCAAALIIGRRCIQREQVQSGGSMSDQSCDVIGKELEDSSLTESSVKMPAKGVSVLESAPALVGREMKSTKLRTVDSFKPGRFRDDLQKLEVKTRERVLRKLAEAGYTGDGEYMTVDKDGFMTSSQPIPAGFKKEKTALIAANAPGGGGDDEGITEGYSPVPVNTPPAYHSRPGSPNVVYIDFNGGPVEGTWWNTDRGIARWDIIPYDTDGDTNTFSDAEQANMYMIWERLSETFSPFEIDVTTEDPGTFGPTVGHIMISEWQDAGGQDCPHNGAGGVSLIDVFGRADYATLQPAWVSPDWGANAIAGMSAHEFGHNLWLYDDGQGALQYYEGHSSPISWCTIMGGGNNLNLRHWSKGEYYNANNTEDDLADISGVLGYRLDDHGDRRQNATLMTVFGPEISASGVIEQTDDEDVFEFAALAGPFTVTGAPYRAASGPWGGMLDMILELRDSGGGLITSSNPSAETRASISTTLPSDGTYYLHVLPTGVGTPLNNPPTGYTVYASLGQYTLAGTVTAFVPEMDVSGNGVEIVNGDNTPSAVDDTDFGAGVVSHVFTITNSGLDVLNLTGIPIVQLSGNTDFTVTSQPGSSTIASGGSTTFTVQFNPSMPGEMLAAVSIANDDHNENPYGFTLHGMGLVTPVVSSSAATGIGGLDATLNGNLTDGVQADVYVYWGTTDGGIDPGQWDNVAVLSSMGEGSFSHDISGLSLDTLYYYNFYAENIAGVDWAASGSFTTLPAQTTFNVTFQEGVNGYSGCGDTYICKSGANPCDRRSYATAPTMLASGWQYGT